MLALSVGVFFTIVIILESLVFYKYKIDTSLTIKELKVDRDTYRNTVWNFMKNLDRERKKVKETNAQQNNLAYLNIKQKIKVLHDDVLETDFSTSKEIKEDLLFALKNIESYGD